MLGQRTGQALLLLEAGDGRLCPHETAPLDAPPSPTSPSSRASIRSSEFLLLPQLSLASLSRFSLSPHGTSYGRRVRVPDCPQRAVAREIGPRSQIVASERCPPSFIAAVAVGRSLDMTRAVADDGHPARGPVLSSPCVGVGRTCGLCSLAEWVTEETMTRQSPKLHCRCRKRVLTFEPIFTERGEAAKYFSSSGIVSAR